MYFHVISQRRAFVVRELARRAGFAPDEIHRSLNSVVLRSNSN
jgi:hypothetical protein